MKLYQIITVYIIPALLLLYSPVSLAQSVTVDAAIDSCQRLIGEQAIIKLEISADANKKVVLPTFDKEIIEGIEIVEKSIPDTQYLNNGKRMLIREEYTITSFDTALYVIPPFEVLVDDEPYFSKELALGIYTIPVDTLNQETFFGPKDLWRTSLTWDDWKYSVLLFISLLILAAITIWLYIRFKNNKPIIRIVKTTPKLPAHLLALKEIENIKNDEHWRREGKTKEYYTALTDAIRKYINERFGFNATEMTTDEIITHLIKNSDKESLKELELLLKTADLVKFARYTPLMNENDMNIYNAIEFVNHTKQNDSETKVQPTEVKIVNQRSKRTKQLLLASVILLVLAFTSMLILLIKELLNLLN